MNGLEFPIPMKIKYFDRAKTAHTYLGIKWRAPENGQFSFFPNDGKQPTGFTDRKCRKESAYKKNFLFFLICGVSQVRFY